MKAPLPQTNKISKLDKGNILNKIPINVRNLYLYY